MRNSMPTPVPMLAALFTLGCAGDEIDSESMATTAEDAGPLWTEVQDSADLIYSVVGFEGPEAVRYDPDQDVWFVANFGPSGDEGVGDGYISRVNAASGSVEALRWAVSGAGAALEDPRGMDLQGDTLWVADDRGVHAYHRSTGEPLDFVDMTGLAPGFINDVSVGPDGSLYVTDTGESRVYRITAGEATVVAEGEALGFPNGITWDGDGGRFLLVPWTGGDSLRAMDPATGEITIAARSPGGNFDGVEPWAGGFVVASQADSALHIVVGEVGRPFIEVGGRPADIAIDTRRGRVAIPYIALDRIDVYALPAGRPAG